MKSQSNRSEKRNERKTPNLGTVKDVEQKLYSKNTTVRPYARSGFSDSTPEEEVALSWNELKQVDKKIDLVEKDKKQKKPLTTFAKLFIFSLLFFVFSVAGAFMVFMYGQNSVSYEAVTLAVRGPNSIAGGEELAFDISVVNDNTVPLVLSDVVVSYPRGTVTADASATPMNKDTASIDEIRSGFEETVKFNAIIFGQEGETKDINIVFQYRVPGSDNIFFKERMFQVVIESSPVTVSVKHEPTYQSGDEMDITVLVTPNIKSTLRNLLLQVDYPFGFQFTSSSVSGLDESTYLLSEVVPGEVLEIKISGVIVGQDNEERAFRYRLGSQDPERPESIASEFSETKSVLAIAKPAINLKLAAKEDTSVLYVARSGSEIDLGLSYLNTLTSKLLDAKVVATLSGSIFNKEQVVTRLGFYRSGDNTITWSQSDNPGLANIESGQSGLLDFTLRMLKADKLAGVVENPEMTISIVMDATNFEDGGSKQNVTQSITKRITLATDVAVAQRLLYSVGPLTNIGPIQPTVDTKSTYSVHWQIANTTNKVTSSQVSAVLPANVRFKGVVAPENQTVTFDERSRKVTWLTEEVSAGAGYTLPPQEVYFTVEVEPSVNQLDQNIDIVGQASMVAQDDFTGVQVTAKSNKLNSRLQDDPLYVPGDSRVVE